MGCAKPTWQGHPVIEETARVIACDGELAQVQAERRSTCSGCSARSGCGSSVLDSVFGRKAVLMVARNPLQARPGERVIVGVTEKGLVQASLILYALPLLGLILFAILGQLAAERLPPSVGEIPSILAGLFGLIAGLAFARHRCVTPNTREAYPVVILRRADDTSIFPGRS
jgi:sigma-E factor negative regulatory protein RseC